MGNREIEIVKVNAHDNAADALTKHVDHDSVGRHVSGTSQSTFQGRHAIMPDVATSEQSL